MASVRLNNCTVSINNYQNQVFHQVNHIGSESASATQSDTKQSCEAEDAILVPESPTFFCTERFEHDTIAREVLRALSERRSKVDKCRELYRLERLGYISFRDYTDQQKADALNAYQTDIRFSRDDFRNAR